MFPLSKKNLLRIKQQHNSSTSKYQDIQKNYCYIQYNDAPDIIVTKS